MPESLLIDPKIRLVSSPTVKYVTRVFQPQHKASYKALCSVLLKHEIYMERGAFLTRWQYPSIDAETHIAYLVLSRRIIAVAYIRRDDDFGWIVDRESEGLITCYVKPDYRGAQVASKLCNLVLESGKFTHVSGMPNLQTSIERLGVKFCSAY